MADINCTTTVSCTTAISHRARRRIGVARRTVVSSVQLGSSELWTAWPSPSRSTTTLQWLWKKKKFTAAKVPSLITASSLIKNSFSLSLNKILKTMFASSGNFYSKAENFAFWTNSNNFFSFPSFSDFRYIARRQQPGADQRSNVQTHQRPNVPELLHVYRKAMRRWDHRQRSEGRLHQNRPRTPQLLQKHTQVEGKRWLKTKVNVDCRRKYEE